MADALNEYAAVHSAGYSDWTTGEVGTPHRAPSHLLRKFAADFARVFGAERTP